MLFKAQFFLLLYQAGSHDARCTKKNHRNSTPIRRVFNGRPCSLEGNLEFKRQNFIGFLNFLLKQLCSKFFDRFLGDGCGSKKSNPLITPARASHKFVF